MKRIIQATRALLLGAFSCAVLIGCTGKQVGGTVGAIAGAAALDDSPQAGAEIGSAVGKGVGKAAAKEKDEPVVNTASDRQEGETKRD